MNHLSHAGRTVIRPNSDFAEMIPAKLASKLAGKVAVIMAPIIQEVNEMISESCDCGEGCFTPSPLEVLEVEALLN